MKQLLTLLILLLLLSCGKSTSEEKNKAVSDKNGTIGNTSQANNNAVPDSQETTRQDALSGFEKAILYKMTDTLSADFNGDGYVDKAFYKKEDKTSGIIIRHGQTNEEIRIGFGKEFYTWTSFDCNWVNYWGIVEDKETSETVFDEEGDVSDSRIVKLQNPSIVLGEDEVGGGLITFLNGKYVWIHQTC